MHARTFSIPAAVWPIIIALIVSCSCNDRRPRDASTVIYYKDRAIERSTGPDSSISLLRRCIEKTASQGSYPSVTVDYPFNGTVFPPEIVAPEILWHDQAPQARIWMAALGFDGSDKRIVVLADGRRAASDPIDSECVRDNNRWEESAYRASARGYTPDSVLWQTIKEHSRGRNALIDLYGIAGGLIVSHGRLDFTTSNDPVNAPIFYRDVPLMPSRNPSGVIQPLSQDAIALIAWRLRDIAKQSAPVVMKHMPTCINCHSFSADGKTLGMDMDGPNGDKGAYALVPTAKRILIRQPEVFTWNKFNPRKNSFGLFARVSPDGRYVASAVEEEVHVVNYMDFHFLQTFYPTRGRIVIYDKQLKRINTLPGADDSAFVQCNPVWSPDGKWVAFLRARACPAFGSGPRASYANDAKETRIRYDLYRVPFNGGSGGVAQPVSGASRTGKSVSFPKYSPDGKWIVFVQANNGLLMRPDSRLSIIPAQGGAARELQCNLPLMNSWHSFSPNGKWMVFSSKAFTPFTQMFLTHFDDSGNASPAVLIPHSTAPNRAVNLPEFLNLPSEGIVSIITPAVDYKIPFERSKKLLDSGDIDSAYAAILRAIALKPDFAENYSTLAFVLAKKGKVDEALDASLKAVKNDPSNDWLHAASGMLFYGAKKIPEALKELETALMLNANNGVNRYYYGLALAAARRYREAVEQYDKALLIDGSYADAFNERGAALYALRRVDDAIADFSRAIAIAAKAAYYRNRAIALADKKKFAEAFVDLDKGISADSADGMTYYTRGAIRMSMRATDRASADFSAALSCKHPYALAAEPLCDIYFSQDKYAQAAKLLNGLIEKDSENALIVNKRAIAFMYSGDAAKAIIDFDFVLSKAPAEPSAYFNKALCLEKLGDMGSAVQNYFLAMRYGSPSTEQYAFAKRRVNELKR